MSRRKAAVKRDLPLDTKYASRSVGKFINHIMLAGKKTVAQNIVYRAFDIIEKKAKQNPLEIFERAIEHVRPKVEVKSRRTGGAVQQVPVEVAPMRALTLAMRWIISYARDRSDKSMEERLAAEILDASLEEDTGGDGGKGRGGAAKKRADTHRMAEANKAFAKL
jgi:small subunit ribosomal protein S7